MNLNLRFIFVAIAAAWMGFMAGGVWQMQMMHKAQAARDQAVMASIDKAYETGYTWGRAECEGTEDQR